MIWAFVGFGFWAFTCWVVFRLLLVSNDAQVASSDAELAMLEARRATLVCVALLGILAIAASVAMMLIYW